MLTIPELFELARSTGRFDGPVVRQKLARLVTYVAHAASGRRSARRYEMAKGRGVGLPEHRQAGADPHHEAVGRDRRATSSVPTRCSGAPDGPRGGRYAEALVFSVASSIYGGTDQIQRNVIGERALGLPREPDPNKGLPFREVLERTRGSTGEGRRT